MQTRDDRTIAELMEQLIESGPEGLASAFTAMLNLAMRMERERHLGAGAYERTPERVGHANGYKPKKIDTTAGTLTVQVPKSRGGETPFYPQSLERGRRSTRAVMLAIAQMYIQGVSTRDVEKSLPRRRPGSWQSSEWKASPRRRSAGLLRSWMRNWRHGAPVPSVPSPISSSTPDTRRHGSMASSATSPFSRPSASVRTAGAAFWVSPSLSLKPKYIGASSSTASWGAACAAYASSPATTMPVAARSAGSGAQGGLSRCHMAAMPVPPRSERHPPRADTRHPKSHRTPASGGLERLRSRRCRG